MAFSECEICTLIGVSPISVLLLNARNQRRNVTFGQVSSEADGMWQIKSLVTFERRPSAGLSVQEIKMSKYKTMMHCAQSFGRISDV